MDIRKAVISDVDAILTLIQQFAEQGLMLPRSAKSIYENLQCFTVAASEKAILGVAGLQVLWNDLAEIRSLAVDTATQGQGVGRSLVQHLTEEAEKLGIRQVLSLTYQTAFFHKLGFEVVEKETLPHKIWKDCIHCKKYAHCDETAMVYYTKVRDFLHDIEIENVTPV